VIPRRSLIFAGACGALLAAYGGEARAAQTLRVQVDQHGDFKMIGNTLGQDCGPGVPAPVVGTVGACGGSTADSSPDVFWRSQQPNATSATASNAITLAQSRSTAILTIPTGAALTHAYLYWAARKNGAGGDNQVTLDRPGGFTNDITATQVYTLASGTDTVYQSVADVSTLVKTQGEGAYRVTGVDATNFVGLNENVTFAAWSLIVFYSLATDPTRNLALFDGLDNISMGNPSNVTLSGFLVPTAGFDAKLGVLTYEGDDQNTGDSLLFGKAPLTNADRLSDGVNPIDNFFNDTHSFLGNAVSVSGDLPQLTGGARSMSSVDMDVVNVTSRVTAGQTSADIQATTNQDVYYLGAFVTSISTFKPDFNASTKTVADLNGGSVVAGDVLEYTLQVVNQGNDTAVGVVLTDVIPSAVTYVTNSTTIDGVAKTDALPDDQVTFTVATRTLTARLGTGANATNGGSMAISATTTVKFRVTVNAGTSGTISNQANITASGLLGAPQSTTPTDGNGSATGQPPTDVVIDECTTNAQCPAAKPVCNTAATPKVCVVCLTNAQCPTSAPVCNTTTHACVGCTTDANCPAALPACLSTGACGECSATNATKCTGAKPVCDTTGDVCVGCLSNANCRGETPICSTATQTCTG
jgi:clumping factor A